MAISSQRENALAVSEILAINDHQFLVDERDGTAGANGTKLLYEIDLDQASPPTDLTGTAYTGTTASNGLPTTGTPAGVTPLSKTLFANIGAILNAANPFVSGTGGLPDKIEGYTWGPTLPNCDLLLLATNDNDFTTPGTSGYRPDYIFAFAVHPSAVPGFQAEAFVPAPELASLTLFGGGLLGLLLHRACRN